MERYPPASFQRDSERPLKPPIEIVPHGNAPFRFPGNSAKTMLYGTGYDHPHPAPSKKEHLYNLELFIEDFLNDLSEFAAWTADGRKLILSKRILYYNDLNEFIEPKIVEYIVSYFSSYSGIFTNN